VFQRGQQNQVEVSFEQICVHALPPCLLGSSVDLWT
jgi:hypothetical protein